MLGYERDQMDLTKQLICSISRLSQAIEIFNANAFHEEKSHIKFNGKGEN
jgi:hypothetical protein